MLMISLLSIECSRKRESSGDNDFPAGAQDIRKKNLKRLVLLPEEERH